MASLHCRLRSVTFDGNHCLVAEASKAAQRPSERVSVEAARDILDTMLDTLEEQVYTDAAFDRRRNSLVTRLSRAAAREHLSGQDMRPAGQVPIPFPP